jgi:hypothetical protein
VPRLTDNEYTYVSEREVSGSGLGTSPATVAAFMDLQRAVHQDQPADTAEAQAAADAADTKAQGAQASADQAQGAADTAQGRADAAYHLAETKVSKDAGLPVAAPTATPSRASLPTYSGAPASATYSATEISDLKAQVAALTGLLAAVVTDLRDNHALTP